MAADLLGGLALFCVVAVVVGLFGVITWLPYVARLRDRQFEREMAFRMRGAQVLGKAWEAQQASDGR